MGKEDASAIASNSEFELIKASPFVGDLMRRLYTIRSECGYQESPEERKRRLEAEKEALSAFKKLDNFEKKKTSTVQKMDSAKEQLQVWKQKGGLNQKEKTALMRLMNELPEDLAELQELTEAAAKGVGVWQKLKGIKCPPEIREQRRIDYEEIDKYYNILRREYDNLLHPVDGGAKGEKYKKAEFSSIDSLEKQSDEELNKTPKIDISEGLKQIEEKKHQVYAILDNIDKQLDEMKGIADACKDELNTQLKLLDKIEKDVEKYDNQLEKTNKRLEDTIKKVGGPTNLLFVVIGLIVILAVIAIAYFALSSLWK